MSEELDEEIAATGADDKAAEHTKQVIMSMLRSLLACLHGPACMA